MYAKISSAEISQMLVMAALAAHIEQERSRQSVKGGRVKK
jgi:hypothetical protein